MEHGFEQNPQSEFQNSDEMRRLHWRCRRGLLELDIVLGRFVEGGYAELDQGQLAALDALLDMPDTVLWDMITGKEAPPQDAQQQNLLERLRAA